MKIFLISFLFWPFIVNAQSVDVNDISAKSSNTTIEIKKDVKPEKEFEIVSDEADVDGDPAPLMKEARNNWKMACSQWKKETKELNKENQVLAMNCGTPQCTKEGVETICSSKGKYKLKVRVK